LLSTLPQRQFSTAKIGFVLMLGPSGIRRVVALLMVTIIAASCAQQTPRTVVVTRRRATPTPATTAPKPTGTTTPGQTPTTKPKPNTTTDPGAATDYHDVLNAAIADLPVYWNTAFRDTYGRSYKDLRGGVIAATRKSTNIPACGGQGGAYKDVRDNASYCSDGQDYIVYDDQNLAPDLAERYGAASMAVVLAHEWGHAVQFRANVREQSIIMEQQADCFAGSWTSHAINDQPAGLTISADDLDGILAALISVSDLKGTDATDNQAHGSGFDRASAFQDGFSNGPKACAKYPDTPPVILELPFKPTDPDTEGNLPYLEAITAMTTDLDLYFGFEVKGWVPLAPGAPFTGSAPKGCVVERAAYCQATKRIVYDDSFLSSKAYRIGDFAVGFLLAGAWAEAALELEGNKLTGTARSLRADCYIGSWTKDQIKDETKPAPPGPVRKLELSPGDLDEGVVAALRFRSDDDAPPFDRLAAFRKGLLGGRAACT
jgi:predicted metalloprotease